MRTDGRINGTRLTSQRNLEDKFGCSYLEYLKLRDHPDKPIAAFVDQRRYAVKVRGVEWDLSLTQWWSIWHQSGFWEKRGRHAHAYCMCRRGDVGPYAVGNVFIALFRENSSVHPNKKTNLPMGVLRPVNENCGYRATRRINGKKIYLGTFATADLAGAAYIASIKGEMV